MSVIKCQQYTVNKISAKAQAPTATLVGTHIQSTLAPPVAQSLTETSTSDVDCTPLLFSRLSPQNKEVI